MSDKEISEYIKTHSESSVATKRKRLGLTRSNRKYTFDDVIFEFSKHQEYECLAKQSDYIDSATNSLPYICKKHKNKGVQLISLGHLQGGRGCFYCGRERTEKSRMVDPLINDMECKTLCKSKGFIYKGWHYENGLIYIDYICPDHYLIGIQKMKKGNMSRKNIIGCPYCFDKKKFKFSKGEFAIKKYLDNKNIDYICQYTFNDCRDINLLPFDFYLPKLNIIIEFDGQHHFHPVQFNGISTEEALINHNSTLKHDKIKDSYCLKNNIDIIRIPYFEKKNIDIILDKKLKLYC